jgi:hypothetical protein
MAAQACVWRNVASPAWTTPVRANAARDAATTNHAARTRDRSYRQRLAATMKSRILATAAIHLGERASNDEEASRSLPSSVAAQPSGNSPEPTGRMFALMLAAHQHMAAPGTAPECLHKVITFGSPPQRCPGQTAIRA